MRVTYPDKCMNKDGRRHDSTSTTIRNLGLISNNFSTLASLGESDHSRALRRKEGGFLIRLNLDEDYIKKPQQRTAIKPSPSQNKQFHLNSHWISLCRLYEAAKDRPVLRVENTRSNCLSASLNMKDGSYKFFYQSPLKERA